jgi:Leucine-rich repeat (LRR) protein
MERKTEVEKAVLTISAKELMENLSKNRYKENPDILQNLKIDFTNTRAHEAIEFEKILALLQDKGLSSNLRRLDVSGNRLRKLPSNIVTLTGLTSLDLGYNYDLTELAGLEHLTALTSLNVNNNRLTELAGLEHLTALTSLNVSSNRLKKLPSNILTLTGLTSLDLSYNHDLTELEGLEHLTTLTSLNVSNNPQIKIANLEHLTALTSLNVSYNSLTELTGLEHLTALTSLDASRNQLTILAGVEPLKALTSLDVSNNQLREFTGLEHLTALTSLNVNNNRLTELAGLEHLTALTSLNVSYNPQIKLADLEHLTALTSLGFSGNQLTTLAGIERLTALTSLSVNNNSLTELACIEYLTALTSLNVNNNQLTTLAGLEHLTALTTLWVSHNQLTTLAGIERLTALASLDVMFNKLTKLPISLGNCAALNFLHVVGNPLQAGTPSTIEELKAQFFKLHQVYRRQIEISGLLNENVSAFANMSAFPSEVSQIMFSYDSDSIANNAELKNLSEEELALLQESLSTTEDKVTKTPKKVDALKAITDLHEAIKDNNLEAFQKLIFKAQKLSINLDTKIGDANYTLLHVAAFNNEPEFTRLLLENGANPNKTDRNGYTPVATAVVRGNHDVLAAYQQHPAQAGQALLVPITPETWKIAAIKYETIKEENPNGEMNYKEMREILNAVLQSLGIVLEQPENQNINVQLKLFACILIKDAVNLKKLLDENPTIDLNVAVKGTRLLHAATAQNDEEIVKLLLEAGANPNITVVDSAGQAITPVHIAADKNLQNMLKLYRERKNVAEETWTEALRAAEIKRTSSVKSLFDAIVQNQFEVFKDILSKNPGLDVNATDPAHPSLLHAVSRRGVPLEFAKQLLASGANPNIKRTFTKGPAARALTPVDVAATEGRADLIELYMASKIPVEEITWQGVRFGGPYSHVNTGSDADYSEAARLVEAAWSSLSPQQTASSSSTSVIVHTPKERPKR